MFLLPDAIADRARPRNVGPRLVCWRVVASYLITHPEEVLERPYGHRFRFHDESQRP